MSEAANTRSVDRMVVKIEHLDKLLNLAGEVIINSSTLHELQRDLQDAVSSHRVPSEDNIHTIKSADESSRRISQDLHDLVMAIRMVEIGDTFRVFRRPIRDLSRNLKKEIDLKFEGEKVLVDKALTERLVEPLLHLLRNAADHGLETPMERTRNGKNPKGTILLEAKEYENDIEIIVKDDGRGIDEHAIIEKAQKLGLVRNNDNHDVLDILCLSGLSTKEQVTGTSGRGVGLDIVKSMVNDFGGELSMSSHKDVGTEFTLRIPKLRAVNIIDSLIVRVGDGLFAFSIDRVVSLQGMPQEKIGAIMDRELFFQYHGKSLPLYDLQILLGGPPTELAENEVIPIVIIEGKRDQVAVIVNEFLSPQKLVNVPINMKMFGATAQGIAGTCILSGGRVGLTVDVDFIVAKAVSEQDDQPESIDETSSFWNAENEKSIFPGSISEEHLLSHDREELQKKAELSPSHGRISGAIDESTGKITLSEGDVSDLLDELNRGLTELQDTLLNMESDDADPELMREAFRRLHAAKGNFTMLGAEHSAGTAHSLETLLDYVRKDQIVMSQELMDLLLDGVGELLKATKMLPNINPPPNTPLLARMDEVIRNNTEQQTTIADNEQLLGQSFSLVPIVELQLLGALKQGANTFETFLRFQPGRQADYLVAYLTLRKLCYKGTILATLPSIGDIVNGNCGTGVKVLWASSMNEKEVNEDIESWGPLYNIVEHTTIPTTVFRYETTEHI